MIREIILFIHRAEPILFRVPHYFLNPNGVPLDSVMFDGGALSTRVG